jgi:Ca-activated chloride channel family protein
MRKKSKQLIIKNAIFATVLFFSAFVTAGTNDRLCLDVAMDRSIMPAETTHKAYIRVLLTGFKLEDECRRAPVNVAVVIDKSGSMSGQKIARAKEAAITAIDRLNPNDIVSVVTYDTKVRVIVPATKVSDKHYIFNKIQCISAGGSTALYAGVAKGGQEIRKFLDENRVNRLILLSDGLANVGPQTPHALGDLGKRLIRDGISVSTIGLGLGYNEDLMTELAYKSDGSHYFVENSNDLCRIFEQEFGKAMTAVAQQIEIEIHCEPGIRPVRILGREGHIDGQKVKLMVNQLYSEYQKYAILEVEVQPFKHGAYKKIATVDVSYHNLKTQKKDVLESSVRGRFSSSEKKVKGSVNDDVMVKVIEQIANERNELAVTLRDQGKVKEAQKTLTDNASYLRSNAKRFSCPELDRLGIMNDEQAGKLGRKHWFRTRKGMRGGQSGSRTGEK